ncbi:pseudouridine synthase [Shewanella gelidii]|uniref:Pseudouridine synthase n=1 Tax=Shewanella gelidii TaxID=1642821 RepID=A0A917JL75_9GAMM|nr:pseudouridine synthase [Shewanella gelidii]MCL1096857.1 rRNA pseudouridine synthase [Shewanella gelidii]GGI70672.1 pseudouridine synthase [Shewanella gelidii]
MKGTTRIAQVIARAGICSRREASRRIKQGRITLNGQPVDHTTRIEVNVEDTVTPMNGSLACDGTPIRNLPDLVYYRLNKPQGIDCRLLPERADSLYHLIQELPRVFPVGRLDKDSHGLMVLTNDGDLSQQLMHPSYIHSKTYRVTVDNEIDGSFIKNIEAGVAYGDIKTLPCKAKQLTPCQFEIILTQGLNRQIRRMAQALGRTVIDLQRVAIGALQLDTLPLAEIRPLSANEIKLLKQSKS